jgi:hypothetical protein
VSADTTYYAALQAQIDAHLDALHTILESNRSRIAADLLVVRGLAASVRTMLERVDWQVVRHETILAALDELLDPDAPEAPVAGLRGRAISEAAIVVLRTAGVDGPIKYREWFRLFEQAGQRVSGRDPLASFLTAINRHPHVEQVGERSGLYRLLEDA